MKTTIFLKAKTWHFSIYMIKVDHVYSSNVTRDLAWTDYVCLGAHSKLKGIVIPTAVLAVMKSVCLQGFPWPARLSAETLKVYSRPSIRLEQVYCVALITDSLALTHRRLFLSFFSIQYPVIGDPPSLFGRSHDRITKSLLILLTWRF